MKRYRANFQATIQDAPHAALRRGLVAYSLLRPSMSDRSQWPCLQLGISTLRVGKE